MSFDGYHVDGMSIKTWAYSTLLVGFHLSLGVCGGKCIQGSFKNHVTDNLLTDYLYRIEKFQHPFEQTKPEYTALSIFNMLCSSWLENKDYYDTQSEVSGNNESSESNETKKDSREFLMHSYRMILSAYLGIDVGDRSGIKKHCLKHACHFSYNTKDISPKVLQSMYYATCKWDGEFPACPSPQMVRTPMDPNRADTSSSTVQASTVTTTPVTAYQSTTAPSSTTNHQSINPSTPTSPSTTSYQSISASASPFQVSQMTDSTVHNDPMTSTPFSTTNHQSISASASPSQLSHKTEPPVSNDPSTPTPSSTTDYETVINNGNTCPIIGEVEALKSKNLVFTFLFIVSGLANVVLIIIVWSQCRRRRQYLQEPIEVLRTGDITELVILNGTAELQ